jgi:ABC-type uncharacterized transport system substrate-binding protein
VGLEERKHFVLDVRDIKGNVDSASAAARDLEGAHVDVIFAVGTSIAARVKQATKHVPIVFYAGSDPVKFGLGRPSRSSGDSLSAP